MNLLGLQRRNHSCPDAFGDRVHVAVAVDDRPAVAGCKIAIRGSHLRVKLATGLFDPVGRPRPPLIGNRIRDIQHDHQIRRYVDGCDPTHRSSQLRAESTRHALVDDGRGRVSVAEHHGTHFECRSNDLCDVLGPIGVHQQQFGPRVERTMVVEQRRPKGSSPLGRTGFERRHDRSSVRTEPLGEPRHLRALAAALAAFEHDEHAGRHVRSVRTRRPPRRLIAGAKPLDSSPVANIEVPGSPSFVAGGKRRTTMAESNTDVRDERAPDGERSAASRHVRRTLKIVAFLFVAWYLILPQLAGTRKALDTLADVKPQFLAGGLGLQLLALLAYSQLTRVALNGTRLSLFRVFRIQLATKALTNVVPAGSAAGTALGYRLLTTSGVAGADAGFALAATGLASAVVLNLILWIGLLVSIPWYGVGPLYGIAAGVGALLLAFAAFLVIGLIRGQDRAQRILHTVTSKLRFSNADRIEQIVEQIATRLGELLGDPKLVRRAFFWASMNWLLDAASLFVFLWAFGPRPPVIGVLVAFGVAMVMAVIPITPGGLGVVEGVLVPTLVGFGVTRNVALIGVPAYRLAGYWMPIPLGSIMYFTVRKDQRPVKSLREAAGRAYETSESRYDWAEHYGHRPASDLRAAPPSEPPS